jgi:hypothetical protein
VPGDTAAIASERPDYGLRAVRRHPARLAPFALGALLVAVGAWLMYETRGTTLWFDEWQWALEYNDNSLHAFIAPHNGHPTLVPVIIYRLLFATVGIDHSAPYRALGIGGHLLCVALLYAYVVRRAGAGIALLASGAILFLGPGWQNILWGLQIGWLVSIAAGLAAMLLLDRRDRFGDVAACVVLVIGVFSSGPGVAIAAGLAVEVLRTRGWRALWIVGVSLGLFAVWWLGYQDSSSVRHEIGLVPSFAADSAAATLSAIAGLAGPLLSGDGSALAWGRPLAVAAVALLLWRLWSVPRVPTRVLTLLAILAAFWLLTAVQRAGIGPAEASRYVSVAAVFVVALIVELVRGMAISRRAWFVLAGVALLVWVANVGAMRTGARFLREQGLLTRTGLTTLEITRPVIKPDHPAAGIAGYPFVVVHADQYYAMARDLGTPAASVDDLANAPENVRRAADDELIRIHGVALTPGARSSGGGAAPTVEGSAGGSVATAGGCVTFTPASAGSAAAALDLALPAGGLTITAADGAAVKVRRVADGFPDTPVGRVAPGGTGTLTIRSDRASTPWHVRAEPEGRMTACGR